MSPPHATPAETVVLVVEDDDIMRKALGNDFKRKGYQVLSAPNGTEAFKLVSSRKIDVILSDIRMAGGDGVELLKNVRGFSPGTPIMMFVTGYADLTLEDAYDLGADAVFSKPFDRAALFAAVERSLTPKDELWSRPGPPTVLDFKIELSFPELKAALSGRLLAIGRGGMFVATSGPWPKEGSEAAFKIDFSNGKPSHLEGSAIVRWLRPTPAPGLVSGLGLEFTRLADGARDELLQLAATSGVKAYIPKG